MSGAPAPGESAATRAGSSLAAAPGPGGTGETALRGKGGSPPGADAPPESALGVADRGLWSDLDSQIRIDLPAEITRRPTTLVVDDAHALAVLYADDQPLKVYPLGSGEAVELHGVALHLRAGDAAELRRWTRADGVHPRFPGALARPGDADFDGIPDPLDLLVGGYKEALNRTSYDGRYFDIGYPGGDVPRERGVCTDVIVRALRNAGIDLQREVHEDILRRPSAYPMVDEADTNIDHRRVKTILPYFRRHWSSLASDPHDLEHPYRAGDVVFMDTIASRHGPDHIGVVADRRGASGLPLVINNWDTGATTDLLDLLDAVPVTHRFRLPAQPIGGPIPTAATRLVVVVAASWDDPDGELRRFERVAGDWVEVGAAHAVALGEAGLAWGRGLHGDGASAIAPGPVKVEGDRRSPAGVFALRRAYGESATLGTTLDYTRVDASWRCVDDPRSRDYGRIVTGEPDGGARVSSEAMVRADHLYRAVVVVEHNTTPVLAGAGSCVFLHDWVDAGRPTVGCTAMDGEDLDTLIAWAAAETTLLVALPRPAYERARRAWRLPRLAAGASLKSEGDR